MTESTRLGRRVRRLRERHGLTQVDMARRLGLSASYLNLIEHDQRPLTARFMRRLGEVFDADVNAVSETEDARIAADLTEALADPAFGSRAIAHDEIRDVVGASADFGRAVVDLYRAYRSARDQSHRLGEELRSREVLAGINYDFRGLVASIRSSAEILQDNPDLDIEQRRRFVDVIVADSKRLVPLFGGLLNPDTGISDTASDGERRPTAEDVADFWQTNAGCFVELEAAANAARSTAGIDQEVEYEHLAEYLAREHGIVARIIRTDRRHAAVGRDVEGEHLDIPEALSPYGRILAVAKGLALVCCGDAITRCVDAASWTSSEARGRALSAIADYVATAILMPYDGILSAAREFRYNIERLQRRFNVDFEQVCRRLTTLQRPGAKGIPFHIVKLDMAGNVTWRLGVSGFRVPRYGGICSLWNVHAAFLTPGVTRAQLSRLPDGTTYFSIARAIRPDNIETIGVPRFSAIELGCDVTFARDIVYADGLDLGGAAAVPIGTTCRLCERLDCSARVLPPFRQPVNMTAAG